VHATEPLSAEDQEALETDLLAQFVFARASAGMVDGTIRDDISSLETIRDWLGRPLWEMTPDDADRYFGHHLRGAAPTTRTGKAATVRVFFRFLELRYKADIYQLTGSIVECPLDELNTPRGRTDIQLRIPPTDAEIDTLAAPGLASQTRSAATSTTPCLTCSPGPRPTTPCEKSPATTSKASWPA
jgi:hypothetical protein